MTTSTAPAPWANTGHALKVERTIARVSQTALAAALGVSVSHISHIEAGRRYASPDRLNAIRAAIRDLAA